MNKEEIVHVLSAIVIFTIVLAFSKIISGNFLYLGTAFISAAVVIVSNIFGKKIMANMLDSDVSHRIWFSNYFGAKQLSKPFPTGVVLPLLATLLTSGTLKIGSILEYETSAKKIRAAKRFGYYSYAEMTDWHNALIGAAGIVMTLIILAITYVADFEPIAKAAAFYMFWNMIPVSNTDGTQIFFGSKILWTILSILSLMSALYAVALI
ncbi:MAG TPA: hypothetical protein VHA12_00700 [Candidatus Nanoarchaeia archaeon]|nr:hypothetical protein [Candidatus Nanoarchaeia archaeon]